MQQQAAGSSAAAGFAVIVCRQDEAGEVVLSQELDAPAGDLATKLHSREVRKGIVYRFEGLES